MPLDLWLAFVAAAFVLLMIPGPTVLLVLSYALSQGRRVALATAAGVALGDLVAMSASLAGLGVLVATSAALFSALKWLGAGYLVWLGWRLWRAAPAVMAGAEAGAGPGAGAQPDLPARGVFVHAATVTALNPKSIAFFIAFVPQFLRPEAAMLPQATILTATFVGLAALNTLAYALLADRMGARLRRPGAGRWLNRVGGGALIGMGVMTATLRRA
ncbi:MAG: lysine transporter LysE [Alphaproteobacteria bacterium HGW-Alphaproteobacteria-6]|nr:MAG: lysine transporter LysE [Alphaproteobacteria bacterium HGW-Alphaproteobacteria-6]